MEQEKAHKGATLSERTIFYFLVLHYLFPALMTVIKFRKTLEGLPSISWGNGKEN
jgi:hypothetical protein